MRQLLRVPVVLCLLVAPDGASASKEGELPWSSCTLHSDGIGASGPVDVAATYANAQVTSLTVRAFGREYNLSQAQLQQLKGAYLNGMQLRYEPGYVELGGRTVYVLMYASSAPAGTRMAKRVSVTERGDVALTSEKAARP